MCCATRPVRPVVELGDSILGTDGCLNFFAGPVDKQFFSDVQLHNVHYAATHGGLSSGGSTDDRSNHDHDGAGPHHPNVMITHVGGLDALIGDHPKICPTSPGGKKPDRIRYQHAVDRDRRL